MGTKLPRLALVVATAVGLWALAWNVFHFSHLWESAFVGVACGVVANGIVGWATNPRN